MSRIKGQRSFWEQLQGQWRSRDISDAVLQSNQVYCHKTFEVYDNCQM